jgi:parallel beta-helix repeat protein
LGNSQQNTITRNNITNSALEGIIFEDASNNIIYYNNFVNNAIQATAYEDKVNSWDNGSVGNFWSDYNGTDGNTDGIGDTPYLINATNQDRFPLVNPWDPAGPIDTVPPRLTIVSPVHGVYNETSVPLTFHASEVCSSMSYSLDGQENLTVTGNTTLSGLSNGLHNVTVYAKDEFENIGASETISFSVAEEPFPAVPVAVASGVAVAIIGVGLLVYFKKRKH